MQRDRLLFLEALVEVFALQHLRDGELRRQANDAFVAQLVEPLAVEAHFGLLAIEDLEDLRLVGFGVVVDLLARSAAAGSQSVRWDRRSGR